MIIIISFNGVVSPNREAWNQCFNEFSSFISECLVAEKNESYSQQN
jgi:hypothetical protein